MIPRFISHRGNIDGRDPEKENTEEYIDTARMLGFDVEIDVWKIADSLYLGHDYPQALIKVVHEAGHETVPLLPSSPISSSGNVTLLYISASISSFSLSHDLT